MKIVYLVYFVTLIFAGCTYSKKEVDYPPVTTACDTTNVKYSTTVKPILDLNCNNCHGGTGSLGAGYVFDTYAGVKDELDNAGDEFINSIKHIGSISPMPKGGAKLSDCDISKIEIWIKAGYPNN